MKTPILIQLSAVLLSSCLWLSHNAIANTSSKNISFSSTDSQLTTPSSSNLPMVLGQCLSIANNLRVDDRVRLNANSIAVGGSLSVFANALVNASVNVGLNAKIRDRSVMNGDLTAGTTISKINGAIINGSELQHTSVDDPVIHGLARHPAQGNDIRVASDKKEILEPGSYNVIQVNSRASVVLSEGEYHFSSLKLENNASLIYHGNVKIVVNNKVIISHHAKVEGENSSDSFSLYNHYNKPLELHNDVEFTGQIHAPNAQVRVGARAQYHGCVNSKGLRLYHDSRFNHGKYIPISTTPPDAPVGQCLSIGNNLRVDDRAVLTGQSIIVGGNLKVFANATINADVSVGINAMMRDRSVINGDIAVGNSMSLINNATVSGVLKQYTSTDDPVINRLSLIAMQANNVRVELDKTKTLKPGRYGNIDVRSRGTLILSEGDYHINSLELATNTSLKYSGNVNIVVNNHLELLDRTKVTGDGPTDILHIYSHQKHPVVVATDVRFTGNIHAPEAQVRLGARTTYKGCVNSKGLRLYHDSRLIEGRHTSVF